MKGEDWGRKAENVREQLIEEIEKLQGEKEKKGEELKELKEKD